MRAVVLNIICFCNSGEMERHFSGFVMRPTPACWCPAAVSLDSVLLPAARGLAASSSLQKLFGLFIFFVVIFYSLIFETWFSGSKAGMYIIHSA